MAAKRRAGTELTDRNWEDKEEPEDAGSFEQAGKEVLARRVIKKAKRRFKTEGVDDTEQDDAPKPSPFAGFAFGANKPSAAGFSFKPTTTASATLPSFSFKPSVPDKPPVAAAHATSASTPSPTAIGSAKVPTVPAGTNGTGAATSPLASKPGSQYTLKLQNLNRSVSSWIQKHVQENPVCDLTPVFEDYKKHLREIEKLRTESSGDTGTQEASKIKPDPPASSNPSTAPTFSFGQTNAKADTTPANAMAFAPSTSSTFSFGKSSEVGQAKTDFSFKTATAGTASTAASGFSFRSSDAPKAGEFSAGKLEGSGTGSIFGSAKPFSFGITKSADSPAPASEETQATEEEEYVPPKEEVTTVQEKDSLYSKKCKLYYKKGSAYVERGVGMLHLKKLKETLQMLVRADTNLGNAILNITLPQSLPISRQGKNNLIMMVPLNPPAERSCPQCNKKYPSPQDSNACDSGCVPEATALLVRVKTSEDADEVLEKINQLRGA